MSKIQSITMPSASSPSDVPADNGADADRRKIGRSTGRNYRFSTSIKKALHNQMKKESLRLDKPIGAIFEDAWKVWETQNIDARLYRSVREASKATRKPMGAIIDEALSLWLKHNKG